MIERTLCIIKPDAAETNAWKYILALLICDFELHELHRGRLTREQVERLYAEHKGQPHYERNLEFMLSGEVVVMVLVGDGAVAKLRERVGATDPRKARVMSLRSIFGTDLPRNALHATGSVFEVEREVGIFFPR